MAAVRAAFGHRAALRRAAHADVFGHPMSCAPLTLSRFDVAPVRRSSTVTSLSTFDATTPTARGSGGRSSVSGVVATVFGCTGFLGRYVVHQLGRIGSQVICPWRGDELDYRHLKPMGDLGQIVPLEFELRDRDSVRHACENSNVIINLIGKHYATGYYTLEQANVESAAIIAEVAAEFGIDHVVHVSAADASPDADDEWTRCKFRAEQVIRSAIPSAIIIRPTDMFGERDRFLNRIMTLRLRSPVYPYVDFGEHKLQPVYVLDVANVIMQASRDYEAFAGKTFVLAGAEVLTAKELVRWIMEETGQDRDFREMPMPTFVIRQLYRLMSRRMPFLNPLPIVGECDVDRDARDNVLGELRKDELTFDDLDMVPTAVRSVASSDALEVYMQNRSVRGRLIRD